jgi:hypothetical protein
LQPHQRPLAVLQASRSDQQFRSDPLAIHPRVFSRPPFHFTVATGPLPGGKNPFTRHTLVPRSGRLNGQLLNGRVESSLAGRSNRNWGPSLMTVVRRADFRIDTVHQFDSGPLAIHPRVFSHPPFLFILYYLFSGRIPTSHRQGAGEGSGRSHLHRTIGTRREKSVPTHNL